MYEFKGEAACCTSLCHHSQCRCWDACGATWIVPGSGPVMLYTYTGSCFSCHSFREPPGKTHHKHSRQQTFAMDPGLFSQLRLRILIWIISKWFLPLFGMILCRLSALRLLRGLCEASLAKEETETSCPQSKYELIVKWKTNLSKALLKE